MEHFGVKGVFVLHSWSKEDAERCSRLGLELTDTNMFRIGAKPLNKQVQNNAVTDDGLNWLRGQIMNDDKYGSKMGEMALIGQNGEIGVSSGGAAIRKPLVLTIGNSAGMLVQQASWDTTEANGNSIYSIQIYTTVDTTTPAAASPIFYAATTLKNPYTKDSSQALTVTRYEYYQRA